MERDEVRRVVRATLALYAGMARRTRTQADDLMTALVQSNEERVVDAVMILLQDGKVAFSDEHVTQALNQVGIKV